MSLVPLAAVIIKSITSNFHPPIYVSSYVDDLVICCSFLSIPSAEWQLVCTGTFFHLERGTDLKGFCVSTEETVCIFFIVRTDISMILFWLYGEPGSSAIWPAFWEASWIAVFPGYFSFFFEISSYIVSGLPTFSVFWPIHLGVQTGQWCWGWFECLHLVWTMPP